VSANILRLLEVSRYSTYNDIIIIIIIIHEFHRDASLETKLQVDMLTVEGR